MSTAKLFLLCIFSATQVLAGKILPSETAFLNKINEANLSMPSAWEGYRIREPLLVYFEKSDISVLLNATDIPAGFKPLKSWGLNAGGVFYKHGQASPSKAHFSWSVNLGQWHAVSWRVLPDADIEEEVYTLFHEYFHRFQPERFVKKLEVPLPPKDISDKTVFNYYLEDILLMRALLTTGAEKVENIKKFTCLRASRYKSETPSVIAYELFKERTEGSAEYVGLRSLLPTEIKPVDVPETMTPLLMRRQSFKLSSYSGANSDVRFYFSGPAQMLLLDTIRTHWEQRLEQGESIFGILSDYFPIENCSGRIGDLEKAYDFSGLLAEAKAEAATLRAYEVSRSASVSDLKSQKRVILKNLPFWAVKPPQSYSNPVKIDEKNTLYDSAELIVSDDKRGVKLGVNGLPLIYVTDAKKPTGIPGSVNQVATAGYEILLEDLSDIEIAIDGKTAPKGRKYTLSFKAISLKGLRLNLESALPGKIRSEADSVVIEFN
ncbi:MAG TPA: hypothetical protein DCL44_09215 [Elusimicrobia bacterium]|nr:hypothetical protein [Elusimicrobiota bacterium]